MSIEWIRSLATFFMIVTVLLPKSSTSLILTKGRRILNCTRKLGSLKSSGIAMSAARVATLVDCDAEGIRASGEAIKAGGLVAFPTETVYGLGANALNDSSVRSIFAAKKRPSTDPLIVHVLGKDDIYDLYDFEDTTNGISKAQIVCEYLAENFWPGPLTIIFKSKSTVPLSVTAGSGFVGLRSPKHPTARLLLEAAGLPIAAPSANRFGHVSPTCADHVMQDLGEESIIILKDDVSLTGGCTVGIESTVCRVSKAGDVVSILRCGAVTSEDITASLAASNSAELMNVSVVIENEKALIKKGSDKSGADSIIGKAAESVDNEAAVAPGQMIKHYAPDIPTYIVTAASSASRAGVVAFRLACQEDHDDSSSSPADISIRKAFIIDFGGQLKHFKDNCSVYVDLSSSGVAEEACNRIFEVLRMTEDPSLSLPHSSKGGSGEGVTLVLLPDLREAAERNEMVRALWERLHRAASGSFVC
jgi:L-threonylcarbamoyladenylate synthase